MVLQEEKKKEVSVVVLTSSQVVFAFEDSINVKNNVGKPRPVKKDYPLCAHCGILGHNQNKFYKLHVYSLRYDNSKGKPDPASAHHILVYKVVSSFGV